MRSLIADQAYADVAKKLRADYPSCDGKNHQHISDL